MSWVRWSDLIAVYAAGVSTYTAFRWLMEERPYLTVFQSDIRQLSGSVTIKVHNPGRKMIFVVGERRRVIGAEVSDALMKITPIGDRQTGITLEYAAHLINGTLCLGIKPGGAAELSIGPVYDKQTSYLHSNGIVPAYMIVSTRHGFHTCLIR